MRTSHLRPFALAIGLLLVASLLLVAGLSACSDDGDDTSFSEIPTSPPAEPDPEADPEPDPEADPEPDPEPEQGIVEPQPEGSELVNVSLMEWQVVPEFEGVAAGQVYFLADNLGVESHELVVIRSDAAIEDLPVVDGVVPEDQVDFLGEIEGFAAGSQASGVFELTGGNYILLCNIVEVEADGTLESHFQQGMATTFVVE